MNVFAVVDCVIAFVSLQQVNKTQNVLGDLDIG